MSINPDNKPEVNANDNSRLATVLWRLTNLAFWGWIALSSLHALTTDGININVKITSTAPVQITADIEH